MTTLPNIFSVLDVMLERSLVWIKKHRLITFCVILLVLFSLICVDYGFDKDRVLQMAFVFACVAPVAALIFFSGL